MTPVAFPTTGAYYVEPYLESAERPKKRILRVYGPFPTPPLEAFRAAFFMHSKQELFASKTIDFARIVRRDGFASEPPPAPEPPRAASKPMRSQDRAFARAWSRPLSRVA